MSIRFVKPSGGIDVLLLPIICLSLAVNASSSQDATPASRARVDSAVKGVQDGECLFSNLSFEYSEHIRDMTGAAKQVTGPNFTAPSIIYAQDSECLLVKQKHLFYFKGADTGESAKGNGDNVVRFGYDGVTLRCTRYGHLNGEPGGYANIISGQRPEVPWALDPYQLGFRNDGRPVSEYLMKYVKGVDTQGNILAITFENEETIAGEPCVRLKCSAQRPGKDVSPADSSYALLWLAVNKHYLPLKSEIYAGSSRTNLLEREEVNELREIEPGIFVPWRAVKTNYAKKGTERVASQESTVSVRQASIRPDYPEQFFKDIPIPPRVPVYGRVQELLPSITICLLSSRLRVQCS